MKVRRCRCSDLGRALDGLTGRAVQTLAYSFRSGYGWSAPFVWSLDMVEVVTWGLARRYTRPVRSILEASFGPDGYSVSRDGQGEGR